MWNNMPEMTQRTDADTLHPPEESGERRPSSVTSEASSDGGLASYSTEKRPSVSYIDPQMGYLHFVTHNSHLGQELSKGSPPSVDGSAMSTKSAFSKTRFSLPARLAAQHFSDQQRNTLASYSSVNFQPSYSMVYRAWLQKHAPVKYELDRWFLMVLAGSVIGLMTALLSQCLGAIGMWKWEKAIEASREGELMTAYGWLLLLGLVFITISSVTVTFIYPTAAGSGVPETISYLNGILIHGVFGLRNLVARFVSVVFAVSSGLPTATQGPIIFMSGTIGYGVGQFKSRSLGIDSKLFTRFRNPQDRTTFTTAGVAAGVAAAFNAPIGGLLFAMEDVTSFWNKPLCLQTFFCCGISCVTANLINTAFTAFKFKGVFGNLAQDVTLPVEMNIALFVPCIVFGMTGGLLGAVFTRMNTSICRLRRKVIAQIPHIRLRNLCLCLEVMVLVVLMCSIVIWFPTAFECRVLKNLNRTFTSCDIDEFSDFEPEVFNCNQLKPADANPNDTYYNEVATILKQPPSDLFQVLISRYEYRRFSWQSLLCVFPLWLLMTTWTAGTAHVGGIFVPLLVSGALYGRAAGLALLEWYTYVSGNQYPDTAYWMWIEPGLLALMGAGSLLAGVQRHILSTTVIVAEMAGDINVVLPLLVANFVARFFADRLSKPLFKYQLESKAMPYLDSELTVALDDELPDMELYRASDVMATSVKTLRLVESIQSLANMLRTCEHAAFPITKYCTEHPEKEVFYGLITRKDLLIILSNDQVYNTDAAGAVITPAIDYEEFAVDYIEDMSRVLERVRTFSKFELYRTIYINLEPFINMAPPKIDSDYSLKRTYSLFKALNLRHLVVVDLYNCVVGIITRKDLMPFQVAERVSLVRISERIRATTLAINAGSIKKKELSSTQRLTENGLSHDNEAFQASSYTDPASDGHIYSAAL